VEHRITVYIASHNYGRYLQEAIESVLNQTTEDWELIVVDDNSSDDTPQIMKRYESHPKIRMFRTEGIGLPRVCNLALENARGEYIMRLDGDDVLDENALQILSGYLDREPHMALVFPDYFLIDENGEVFSQHRRQRLYDGNHLMDMPPNGACTMIRRRILEEMGGYRVDLGAQDGFDLWSKVRERYKSGNVNLPLFKYRRHSTNLTNNGRRILGARRRIKLDAIEEQVVGHRPIVAIIPCRRHFEFVEDFWKQEFKGQSLLERTVRTCLGVQLLDKIVVACDNPAARSICESVNDPRVEFFERSAKSTNRSANLALTLEQVARTYDPGMKGLTVVPFFQTPFITPGTIEEAISTLIFNDADSACGVEIIDSQVFRRTPHGLEPINRRGDVRSDFNVLYRDAQTCLATRNANLMRGSMTGATIVNFELSGLESFFIQTEDHLRLARLIGQT
jgi:glycosyltransferase involved in cell wall biosynthesis